MIGLTEMADEERMQPDTRPKPFVFVLMPFDPEFRDVYELGIKPACENAGTYPERVDEQIFSGSILERVYNQISKADIIVADMTRRNPNVFYETGYAHALGKRVILLTKNIDDIPFDLKHYSHIDYRTGIASLKPELEKRVRWFVENPDRKEEVIDPGLQFFIEGVQLTPEAVIELWPQEKSFSLGIDIYHSASYAFRMAKFQIGIITSSIFSERKPLASDGIFVGHNPDWMKARDAWIQARNIIKLPNNRCFHILTEGHNMIPYAWQPVTYRLYGSEPLTDGQRETIVIRVLTDMGYVDHPFSVKFVVPEKKIKKKEN